MCTVMIPDIMLRLAFPMLLNVYQKVENGKYVPFQHEITTRADSVLSSAPSSNDVITVNGR